jgi:hypothetical protein
MAHDYIIHCVWIDPLNNEFCAGGTFYYTIDQMVRGKARKQICALKAIAKTWTGPRSPRLKLTISKNGRLLNSAHPVDPVAMPDNARLYPPIPKQRWGYGPRRLRSCRQKRS